MLDFSVIWKCLQGDTIRKSRVVPGSHKKPVYSVCYKQTNK